MVTLLKAHDNSGEIKQDVKGVYAVRFDGKRSGYYDKKISLAHAMIKKQVKWGASHE